MGDLIALGIVQSMDHIPCCWQIYKQNKYVVIYTHMCTTYLSMAHSWLLHGFFLLLLTLYGKSILKTGGFKGCTKTTYWAVPFN